MADQKAKIVLTAVDQTKGAFNTAKRNFEELKGTADGLLLKFGSLGVALAGVFEGITIKGAIDAADELSKLSQKTGIAIEELSALKLGAELSDVPLENLAKGLRGLAVNMADAAGGGKEAQASFAALGVKVTDAAGKVRSTDDVLGDLADKFASFKDGPVKAADAIAVFKKGGDQLIPFLNQGKDGIAALREEAQKLGIVIGGELGKNAEEFNDNLTRLKAASEGAKLSLANSLLPTLNSTLEAFVKNTEAAGLFKGALLTLGQGLAQRLNVDELGNLQSEAAKTSKEISQVGDNIERLQGQLKLNPGNTAAAHGIDLLRDKMLSLQTSANRTGDAIKKLTDDQTKGATKPEGPKQTKDAPVIKKEDGSGSQLALLKANLAAQTEAIQDALTKQQDVYKFNEQFEQALYQTGNASLRQYYDEQDAQRELALFAQKRALADLTKVQADYQKSLPNTTEGDAARVESQRKVSKAQADFAKAEQDAGQAAKIASVVRQSELDDQSRALDVFAGNLKDLTDGARTHAADLAEIAVKVAAAKKQLIQGGVGGAEAEQQSQALADQLKAQIAFNLAREEFTRITERAKDAEDALALVQQSKGTGLLASEQQVTAVRQQELEQLGKVLEATRALASANPQNETLVANLRQVELAYGHLAATVDATKVRLDAAADSLGSGIANTLGDAIVNGGKLRDILTDIGKQIASTVTQQAVVQPFSTSISNFIKGSGGQGAGTNLLGLATGQSPEKGALPVASADTAGITSSLNSLKTVGVDPTTAALASLTQAVNATIAALGNVPGGGPLSISPTGAGIDAAGHGFSPSKDLSQPTTDAGTDRSATPDNGAQQAADANRASAAASNAAAGALVQLGSGASVANTALSILPSIVSAISASAAASSASGSGGGLLGLLGGLFGGSKGGENIGGTTGGGTFSAASTYSDGGFTGNFGVKQPAGVVHGKEYVFSAPAVANLGVGHLDSMHRAARAGRRGYSEGGYVGTKPGSSWKGGQSMPPIVINQMFAAGVTRRTTDQAAVSAGREAARALGRGAA